MKAALVEKDPAGAAALTLADLAAQKHQAALVAGELKYQALQAQIMESLGLKPEDLSTQLPAKAAPPSPDKRGQLEATGFSAPNAAPLPAAGGGLAATAKQLQSPPPAAKGKQAFSPRATQQPAGKKK